MATGASRRMQVVFEEHGQSLDQSDQVAVRVGTALTRAGKIWGCLLAALYRVSGLLIRHR